MQDQTHLDRVKRRMKILLVTGRLAETAVKRHALESKVETLVVALPISVASLLTPEFIARHLKAMGVKGYDMIMIPGLVKGDAQSIEKVCGIPTFKGPRYSADIPVVLDLIDGLSLSKIEPADSLLHQMFTQQALTLLQQAENRERLKRPGNLLVGDLPVGKDFPMRVMAEILDAPTLSDKQIQSKVKYYVESGAKIVDIGMMAGPPQPGEAIRVVKAAKALCSVPIAIDTSHLEEARAAVEAGADMILSLDASRIVEAASFARDVAVVIVPTDHGVGPSAKEPEARVKTLVNNLSRAGELGYEKIIADPIVDPPITPGLADSVASYRLFSRRYPDVPLLFGTGNVTELMDADSVGVNALLAAIAAETNVSVLLTTEGSNKTRGSVREIYTASNMMFLAKKRSSVPKDLPLDLLILKEKRRLDESYGASPGVEASIIRAEPVSEESIDDAGSYRILMDIDAKQIVAIRYLGTQQREIIKGTDAAAIYKTLIQRGLVTRLDHAAYLGRELTKAEVALKIGRSYFQDILLFAENGDET